MAAMRPILALLALLAASTGAMAQDKVSFASFDGKDGAAPTQLDGYLFRPNKPGPYPAVVFLHGCGGLISASSHKIQSREMEWAGTLNRLGYAVLMVDSFTPRGSGEMCSRTGFKEWLYLRRPADAYGALAWLQQQPFIAKDGIAVTGWSNGGGAVLFALGKKVAGKPANFAGPDFRAAIAFYPGSCSEQRMGGDWTPAIPLLILIGEKDVWTPAEPCRELVDRAIARGARIDFHAYAGAYHDFDWPSLKRKELTAYTTRAGVVPITGEDPAAHADAIKRVPAFLASHIGIN
jgi:dienelactone hydrolase